MRHRQEVSFYNDEYIVSVLKTQDTKFDVLQGYVGAIITETELELLRNGDGTMYSRLASAELTIDGLKRQYSEVISDYSTTTGTLSNLTSRVTTIEESVEGMIVDISEVRDQAGDTDTRLANLKITVDGFSTTVSQAKTEAINSANKATDDKLKNYTVTSQLMSYINQQTGKISLGVIANSQTIATKTDVSTAQKNAETNAKNYADKQLTSYTKTADLTIDLDGIRTSVSEAKTEAINTANTATDNKLKDYKKTTELLSWINQQSNKISLGVIQNSTTLATKTEVSNAQTKATTDAKNYADTQLKNYTKTADLTIDLDGIRTSVSEAKTEAINTANTATDNKLKDYKKTTELITYINQQKNKIQLGAIENNTTLATKTDVSTAQTAATNAAKNYADTQLKNYTKTADLTIDLDGIRTSVSEAKTEAINTANTATDNKLKDYTETTKLITYINQQKNKIQLGAIENNTTLATKTDVSTAQTAATNAAKNYADTQLKNYTKTADLTISVDGFSMKLSEANIDISKAAKQAKEAAIADADSKFSNYTKTTDLMTYIDGQKNSLSLGVIKNSSTLATTTNVNDAVSTMKTDICSRATLIAAINDETDTSTLKLNADYIDLNGKVKCNYIKGGTLSLGMANNSSGQIYVYNNSGKLAGYWKNDMIIFKHAGFEGTLKGSASRFSTNGFSAFTQENNVWTTIPSNGMKVSDGNGNIIKTIYPGLATGSTSDTVTDNTTSVTLDSYTNIFPLKIVSTDARSTTAKYKFALCRDESDSDFGLWMGSGTNGSGYNVLFGLRKNYLLSGTSMASSYCYDPYIITVGNSTKKTDLYQQGNTYIEGALTVIGKLRVTGGSEITGGKNRVMDTTDYGKRLLYCYETAAPQFGDVGEGVISEDGLCYIYIDPVLLKTIAKGSYQVFLQKYGEGDAWVLRRATDYFVVAGTPGIAFGWEIKGLQYDLTHNRLNRQEDDVPVGNKIDYAEKGLEHYTDVTKGGLHNEDCYVGDRF